LDAGNKDSYPGSGTVWRDLAGSNNGDIKSGVSYSNESFNFTLGSSNELIDVAHSEDLNYSYLNWAYSLWMKINFDDNGTWTQLLIKGNDGGNRRPGIWFYAGQTSRFHFTWNAAGQGQQTLNTTDPITTPLGNGPIGYFSLETVFLWFIKMVCKMQILYLFLIERALTPAEVLQNYNATKGRFLL
jgi:hypothetical protein